MLFRVLGPLEVEGSADPVPGSQQRLLAVLLQRANSWVDADTVVNALWPQDPPASAKGNVKTFVHQLRQLLPRALDGSPRINSRSGGYRLNLERAELDAAVFEDLIRQGQAALAAGNSTTAVSRLTQALELWRGEPYGPLGAELAEAEAARLRELRDEALDSYQEAREAHANGPPPVEEPEAERTVVLRLGPPQDVRRPVPDQDLEPWTHWRVEQPRKPRRRALTALLAVVAVLVAGAATGFVLLNSRDEPVLGVAGPASSPAPPTGPTTSAQAPAAQPTVAARRSVPGLPAPGEPKLLFGLGDQADVARSNALISDTPTRMLTTWYRGHADLARLTPWKDTVVAQSYADGFALHLVIAGAGEPITFDTAYGPACGRQAPLLDEFLADAQQLAKAFRGAAGSPPLFVTVFDQLDAYACNPAGFNPDPPTAAYFKALKDRYVLVREVFHKFAPNALVSLGWGAGLARTADDPATGAGMSMLPHFHEVLTWSDFYSVTVANGDGDNAADVGAMVHALGRYGPVMLSWYGPAGNPARLIDADVHAMLDDARLPGLTRDGLFAWSFAPDTLAASTPRTARFVADAIRRYGRPAT